MSCIHTSINARMYMDGNVEKPLLLNLFSVGNFKTIAKLFDVTIVIREYLSEERS